MAELWSYLANDVVEVDEFDVDGIDHCEECDEKIIDARFFDDGDVLCEQCYEELFG